MDELPSELTLTAAKAPYVPPRSDSFTPPTVVVQKLSWLKVRAKRRAYGRMRRNHPLPKERWLIQVRVYFSDGSHSQPLDVTKSMVGVKTGGLPHALVSYGSLVPEFYAPQLGVNATWATG